VIKKFHRQAALKVSNHRNSKEAAGNLADDNTFMKMSMDDIGPEFSANPKNFPQQKKVDVELVD
jgi:hypothetical protein